MGCVLLYGPVYAVTMDLFFICLSKYDTSTFSVQKHTSVCLCVCVSAKCAHPSACECMCRCL